MYYIPETNVKKERTWKGTFFLLFMVGNTYSPM